MIIKEIELSGFKTFVDRVKLNFKPGITAFVGPNGTGKSNIIDALRWIMGEHNVRNLRGSRLEDLIFSGSERRKPIGMAEVSIVLTNSNGNGNGSSSSHPTELMVTRRIFRSGDSEYLINKRPCRLKDVIELFLDFGVSTKSYSVIEQGKIDYILGLKPDERRVIVEEAANISKYRGRKKEALSKLQSTKNNLLRVQDILVEMQSRMHTLELQVKRLKRYNKLSDEIKNIDILIASGRYAGLNKSSRAYEAELKNLKDEELQTITNQSSTESSLEKNRLQLTDLQRNLKELQEQFYDVKNRITQEENLLNFNKNEIKNSEELISKNAVLSNELENEIQKIQDKIISRENELKKLNEKIVDIRQSFDKSSTELSSAKNLITEIKDSIETEKKLLIKSEYEKTDVRNQIYLNNKQKDETDIKLAKTFNEAQQCGKDIEKLKHQYSELESELKATEELKSTKKIEADSLNDKISNLSNLLFEKDKFLNDLNERKRNLKAKLFSLRELQKNLEGFDKGVKTIMDTYLKNNPDSGGIVSLLADSMEIIPEYERALEAVLERKIQSIIVNTPEDALMALEYLKDRKLGRVSFIALQSENYTSAKVDNNDISNHGIKKIISFIKVKQGIEDVVAKVLSDVFVADDLKTGLQFQKGTDRKLTVVTLDGSVIDSVGIISGGGPHGSGTGILQRNREIKLYSKEVQKLETDFSHFASERETLYQEIQTAKQSYQKLISDIQQLDILLVEQKSKLGQHLKELKNLEDKSTVLSIEKTEFQDTLEKLSKSLTELSLKETELNENINKKKQQLDLLLEKEHSSTQILNSAETSHTDLRIRLASEQQKIEHIEEDLNNAHESKNTAELKKKRLENEEKNLHDKIIKLKQSIELSTEKLKNLIDQSNQLETTINEQNENFQTLEFKVSNEDASIKQLRSRLDELKLKIHEIELKVSNNSVHIEHLQSEINGKYNLNIKDIPAPECETFDEENLIEQLEKLKIKKDNIGQVNLGASSEYDELNTRYNFLRSQEDDLNQAIESLQKVIAKINRITKQKFLEVYTKINENFQQLFPVLFNGGKAYLELTDETDILETGIEILAQPPGKKVQGLDLLSGGERALTVIALIFAVFMTKPSPFCLMDEIDAPLDDSNIDRFINHLHQMSGNSQFIIVTHNKLSMQAANLLYGVTMEEKGVSKIVSVELN